MSTDEFINSLRMIRVGDIVKPRVTYLVEWASPGCTGIVIDEMEMEDGFYMFEVMIADDIFWIDSLELELVERANGTK